MLIIVDFKPTIRVKGKSGIYKITNIINGKSYIGSAMNLNERCSQHFSLLKKNKHLNKILQNSFNKYGIDNFKFKILEKCNKELLIEKEQYYIDLLNPLFNIRKIARSNLGMKWSEESILKMKKASKGRRHSIESKNKISVANKGKKRSEEFSKLISSMKKGKTPHSLEYLAKIGIKGRANAAKVNSKKVALLNNGEIERIFDSLEQASHYMNISATSIGRCCNNKFKSAGGRVYKFI